MKIGLGFAIVVASLLVSAGSHAASELERQGDSWKLVYLRYDARRGEGGIGVDIVTSRQLKPLRLARRTDGSRGHFSTPSLSPDGAFVAYLRNASGADVLHVVASAGGQPLRLASGRIQDFVWSADGTSLAFTADCGYAFEGGCRTGRIDVIRRDGSGRRLVVQPVGLSRGARIDLQDWNSAGELLYLVRDRGRGKLHAVPEDGSGARILADTQSGGALGDASWSTDGRWVAYTRRCAEQVDYYCDLAVANRDGGSKRLLYRWGPNPSGPSSDAPVWLPGSSRLLVTIWGFGAHTRLIDVAAGTQSVISNRPWASTTAASDGRTIARFDRRIAGPDDVVVARLDGSVVSRATLPKTHARNLSYSGLDYELWVP